MESTLFVNGCRLRKKPEINRLFCHEEEVKRWNITSFCVACYFWSIRRWLDVEPAFAVAAAALDERRTRLAAAVKRKLFSPKSYPI